MRHRDRGSRVLANDDTRRIISHASAKLSKADEDVSDAMDPPRDRYDEEGLVVYANVDSHTLQDEVLQAQDEDRDNEG